MRLAGRTHAARRTGAGHHVATCCRSSIGGARCPASEAGRRRISAAHRRADSAASDSRSHQRNRAEAGAAGRLSGSRRQAARSGDNVTLATGHGAMIGRESGVHDAEWLIALDVTSGRTIGNDRGDRSRGVSRIEPEWLTPTRSDVDRSSIARAARSRRVQIDWYDALVLREHPIAPERRHRRRACWRRHGSSAARTSRARRLLRRLAFRRPRRRPHRQIVAAAARMRDGCRTSCSPKISCRGTSGSARTARAGSPDGAKRPRDDDRISPTTAPCRVSVKLQELFGLAETPRIGPRKAPITFHLLAPNGRPVQTTRI